MACSFCRRSLTLALWLAFCSASSHADDPKLPPPQKDTLQAVLDRIKQHAAGEAWKQPGFKDDEIEKWLDKLLSSIAIAAGIPDLKLPVRLADVQFIPPERTRSPRGSLIVCQDYKSENLALLNSIVLADGNVTLGHIENSLVVARGTITVEGSSANSIFVAGIGFRGGERDGPSLGRGGGSVVVARGRAELPTSAEGTIVAANAGISLSEDLVLGRATNVIFINAPVPPQGGLRGRGFGGAGRDNGNKSVRVPDLPLEDLPVHPLAAKLKVLGVLHMVVKQQRQVGAFTRRLSSSVPRPTAAILEYEGRRYIVDLDQPVAEESGTPLAVLAGYRLVTLASQYAVLRSPDADLVLKFEGK